ncbi:MULTISPECIES: hypothetical protein [unclassified Mycobacterium]|uniref:hypothetical protein n=1 Tax=unclassified Mycobacterium TaxID=2642494 RepID=UPI0007FF0747|nr:MULTISPECIES: hypothetical protein [unclassified Mycobacterium]OBG62069.1 hypothetical protein A5704_17025 [Mycobacterium sp. E735]OBG66300.1 hypothetical protein A5703_13995 [Mycobacterium sp. E188]OBH28374.1 hypothetical protein A9X03_10290 [Mycobacterium sp. E1715]OBH38636.1 hypothetical protein A5691_02475 [Mycobacterium sp. E183]
MNSHPRALGLLAGAVILLALTGGTGVAHADSSDPSGPGVLNQLITSTPALSPDPADEGGPTAGSNAVGMYCENRFARCH